uniref:Rubis-subs-bind domain-containing protein n=1 Tax=Panagrellus redivivus TaxID=6233 RepID=A0A7E4V230_PANRE
MTGSECLQAMKTPFAHQCDEMLPKLGVLSDSNYYTVEDLYRLVQTRDDVRNTLRNINAPTQAHQVSSKDEQLTMKLWGEVSEVRLERQAKEIVVLYLKQNFTLH